MALHFTSLQTGLPARLRLRWHTQRASRITLPTLVALLLFSLVCLSWLHEAFLAVHSTRSLERRDWPAFPTRGVRLKRVSLRAEAPVATDSVVTNVTTAKEEPALVDERIPAPETAQPGPIETVLALYGGPRRFLLVNIPALLIALAADFLGSMQALLSLDPFQKIVREYRLDGYYQVRGLKRHYIDAPLSCTFSYPGDWVFDNVLESARLGSSGGLYSSRQSPKAATQQNRLPLVSLVAPAGLILGTAVNASSQRPRVAIYALGVSESATLYDVLGPPEAAALVQKLLLAGATLKPSMLPCAKPRLEILSTGETARAATLGGDQLTYEMRVACEGVQGRDLSVFLSAQLTKTVGDVGTATGRIDEPGIKNVQRASDKAALEKTYVLVMLGLAPSTAAEVDLNRVRASVMSLESL